MENLIVHTAEHGESLDRTVVLLHSSGLSGSQWNSYLEPLTGAGWRTITVDFIGNGKSAPWRGPDPFHLQYDVEQALLVLQSLPQRRYVVVGHSYGGFVGLQTLLEPSVKPLGAVFFEPGAWGILASSGSEEEQKALQVTSEAWFSDDAKGGSEVWMQQFVEYWGGAGAWEHIGSRGREGMMRSARQTYAQTRSLAFDKTPLATYESLSVPVHLITGSQSPQEARSICLFLANASPVNSLTEVSGGHMTPVLDPATVVPVLCSKLEALAWEES